MILIGVLVRIHHRWQSVRVTLPRLVREDRSSLPPGPADTPYGPATVTAGTPKPLRIHTMARRLWGPMLAGLAVSLV